MLMKGERRVWKHGLRSTWMGAALLLMASVSPAVAKQPWVEGDKLDLSITGASGTKRQVVSMGPDVLWPLALEPGSP